MRWLESIMKVMQGAFKGYRRGWGTAEDFKPSQEKLDTTGLHANLKAELATIVLKGHDSCVPRKTYDEYCRTRFRYIKNPIFPIYRVAAEGPRQFSLTFP